MLFLECEKYVKINIQGSSFPEFFNWLAEYKNPRGSGPDARSTAIKDQVQEWEIGVWEMWPPQQTPSSFADPLGAVNQFGDS